MYGVTLREYGDESKLKLEEGLAVPEPKSNQVLIKVKASSVNPIDLMKRAGYGRTIFEKQRRGSFFPSGQVWTVTGQVLDSWIAAGQILDSWTAIGQIWQVPNSTFCSIWQGLGSKPTLM